MAPSAGAPSPLETMPLHDPHEDEAMVTEGNDVRAMSPIRRSRRNIPEVYLLAGREILGFPERGQIEHRRNPATRYLLLTGDCTQTPRLRGQ